MSDSRRSKMAPQKQEHNGHEYVDLGLSSGTLWATMNVGATSETDYGNYYMYGKGSRTYNSSDSIYRGTENPLALSADTASQVWGGLWHIPTETQCQELVDECTWTWETIGGTDGCSVSKNGKSIFLPTTGRWLYGSPREMNTGCYWSSTSYGSSGACMLNFGIYYGSKYKRVNSSDGVRDYGQSVRPVIG